MSDLNTGLPNVRQLQSYIKEKKQVEIQLSTGDVFVGRIAWQDSQCVCLIDKKEQPVLLWRQALVYTRLKSE